ncbi:MAG: RIP metalloprotease RseP [Spirochaetales bacterium]
MEILLYIPLGLVGLTVVVFVHELGHFLAARWAGVEVEAFALGWGKTLLKWKPGKTEYRLCLLPLGGYCKMKGDDYLVKAMEAANQPGSQAPLPEEGSYHAASPWRRIGISVAGPAANLLLAFLVFFVLQLSGIPQQSSPARIILLESVGTPYPATQAGLASGDLILSVSGKSTRSFADLQAAIAQASGRSLVLEVQRSGTTLTIPVTPRYIEAEKRTMIGISDWVDPVVASVTAGSSGDIAGFQPRDLITEVGGVRVHNTHDLSKALPLKAGALEVAVERAGTRVLLTWVPEFHGGVTDLGVAFARQTYPPQGKPLLPASLAAGLQTTTMIGQMAQGLVQLFTGQVSAGESLSGPLRISYMVGEQTSRSFESGWFSGLTNLLNDLAFLSLALFFMNLLPIPALDGGSIVLQLYEGLRRKRTPIRVLIRYQQFGGVLILMLVAFTLFNDTSFLMGPK